MNNKFHPYLRVVAVSAITIVALLAFVGAALAAFNRVSVDPWTSGSQTTSTTIAPDGGSYVFTATASVVAGTAVGGHRTMVLTATQAAAQGGNAVVAVDTANHKFSLSSTDNVTPTLHMQWDGGTDPLTFNPIGLGGVNFVSTTNTGFVLEVTGDDLLGTLYINAYTDASNWSRYVLNLPGGIANGSHVDFVAPFSSFVTMAGGGADFANIGAITWDLNGTNSLDLQITDFYASNELDFGDLPEDATHQYGTTLANNGARSIPSTGLRLGNQLDVETDGQPNSTATGDNLVTGAYVDDEDGVTRSLNGNSGVNWTPGTYASGAGGSVDIVFNAPMCNNAGLGPNRCYLRGWIDWNNNGVFESSEVIISRTLSGPTVGSQNLSFDVPTTPNPACYNGDINQPCYARFRICGGVGGARDCDSPTGLSKAGEVEDYAWGFSPTAVTLESLQAQPTTSPVLPVVLVGVSAAALIGVVLFARRGRRKTV